VGGISSLGYMTYVMPFIMHSGALAHQNPEWLLLGRDASRWDQDCNRAGREELCYSSAAVDHRLRCTKAVKITQGRHTRCQLLKQAAARQARNSQRVCRHAVARATNCNCTLGPNRTCCRVGCNSTLSWAADHSLSLMPGSGAICSCSTCHGHRRICRRHFRPDADLALSSSNACLLLPFCLISASGLPRHGQSAVRNGKMADHFQTSCYLL
jgi:hypothetical protein